MPYPEFDISRLDADELSSIPKFVQSQLQTPATVNVADDLGAAITALGAELVKCRNQGGATIFLLGAEVIQAGVSSELNDMIEKGMITHLALNRDSTLLNLGESTVKEIRDSDPHLEERSLQAHAYRWGVPTTGHGPFIVEPQKNPTGNSQSEPIPDEVLRADHLVLANAIENLEQGLVVQFGNSTAIVSFLEGLQAARIVASKYNRTISDFSATLILNESSELVEGVQENGIIPGSASVLGAAEENRRSCIIGDYSDIIRKLHAAALNAGGWGE